MDKLIQSFGTINKYLCAAILITMVVLVFSNTFLRYFFNSGIIITEEFVRYLFLWGIYFGVISVWYRREHIRVTTVLDRVSNRHRIKLSIAVELVSMVILAVLCLGSIEYFFDTTTVGQVTGIPYSVMIAAVVIGTFFCILISFKHLATDFGLLKLSDAELEALAKQEKGAQ